MWNVSRSNKTAQFQPSFVLISFYFFWLSCRPRVYLLFGTIRDKYLRQKMTSTAVLYTATRPSTGTNENATSNTQPDYSREHSERLVSPELR